MLDRRQDQLLLDRRVDHGRLDPGELLLGPGAELLRPAVADLVGHRAPDADSLLAGALRAGVEVRQAEHVAELVTEDADVAHVLRARGQFLADEVGPPLSAVPEARAVRPVEAAARRLVAGAGVNEEAAC